MKKRAAIKGRKQEENPVAMGVAMQQLMLPLSSEPCSCSTGSMIPSSGAAPVAERARARHVVHARADARALLRAHPRAPRCVRLASDQERTWERKAIFFNYATTGRLPSNRERG
jgi:hypothetical protein